MVSEIMLQQTPVARVLPVWVDWMHRWPDPTALAAQPPSEAIRAWGRLGYPRRALRLHAAACVVGEHHDGAIPADIPSLRALPGVGEYTAAAISSFAVAFGDRQVVLDTNVRRVFARALSGTARPAPSVTARERALARDLLPRQPDRDTAHWAAATMELGALVCTARTPACPRCPAREACLWRGLGHPEYDGPARQSQRYEGTNRFVRGLLLAALCDSDGPLAWPDLIRVVPDDVLRDPRQRDRCVDSLVKDGLVEPMSRGRFQLPSSWPHVG